MSILKTIQFQGLKADLPEFRAGDTIKVNYTIKEGDKERVQPFQGVVLQIRGEGISKAFTVRKISNGVAIERVFPLHSPRIASIEVVRQGKVRRARIFYMRDLQGKAARIKDRDSRPKGAVKAKAK